MANLKVFVSSTCFDMHATRAQLRSMLIGIGYEPVMSDQADVIYDPRIHTHTSCLREVANCDIVVLVIGSRFGGATIPKALELIDMDRLSDLSRSDRFGEDKTKISITQAEVLQAIQTGLPVFAFVDAGVMRDHLTYEKNKNKSIINQIEFSSIDKSDTAPYIFEFINFLRLRNENNSIFEFSRFEDIEAQIKKQWAGLFQRLLHEQRTKALEGRRIDNLSSQIADLKAAVLGSISSAELKETAKGAIRFRLMIDFLFSLASEYQPADATSLLHSDLPWKDLLKSLGIIDIRSDSSRGRLGPMGMVLLQEDGTYCRVRLSLRIMPRLGQEWEYFQKLGAEAKDAILNAVLDSREGRPILLVRHYNEQFIEDRALLPDDEVDAEVANVREYLGASNRILLTQDKFVEESIKNYLVANPSFHNMKFLVDVKDGKINLAQLPESLSGQGQTFSYEYTGPEDGKLSGELERLKSQIQRDLQNSNKANEKLAVDSTE
jgi:hypothetical protein